MSTDLLEVFGPYVLLRTLGRGGMGVVYTARAPNDQHPIVALKRMRADADAPTFRERFWHECELALRLRHPHLVQTLEAGEIDGRHFVASALIRGQSAAAIASRLHDRAEGMPAAGALRILGDVLSALRYVHTATEADGRSLELVHRDVTPGNVLVGYDGRSHLADFGLARSLLTDPMGLTAEGAVLGTPRYMAPELVRGQRADVRADLYAVGALAYTLLSGRGPYPGGPRAVMEALLSGPPTALALHRPDLPGALLAWVERLMARRPDDRPATAAEASATLDQLVRAERLGVGHAELGAWLAKLFSAERARDARQRERDLAAAPAAPPARAGTRVLPAVERPLSGDDRLPTVDPEASMGGTLLDGVVPLSELSLDPEPDTDRSPGFPPDPLDELPTVAPTFDALPPTAVFEDQGVTLPPEPTPAPQVSVRPAGEARPPQISARPPDAAPAPTPRKTPWLAAIAVVALLAAGAGATLARLGAAPSAGELVALSERLGAAQARLPAPGQAEARPSLQDKLTRARALLKGGHADEARGLVEQVERALDTPR